MWVVKLGGSLAHSSDLNSWLDVFSETSRGRVVIVPGGGSYADEVRRAQSVSGFDDDTAHCEALTAMEQFGLSLCGMVENLVPAETESEIQNILAQERVAVWMASKLALADKSIPKSWDVTSDSLAAWLATRLNAQALILVKSVSLPFLSISPSKLSEMGVVDKAFPNFVDCSRYQVRTLHVGQSDLMREALRSNELVGVNVVN